MEKRVKLRYSLRYVTTGALVLWLFSAIDPVRPIQKETQKPYRTNQNSRTGPNRCEICMSVCPPLNFWSSTEKSALFRSLHARAKKAPFDFYFPTSP